MENKAEIVNDPKLVVYTICCGGDQGENTLGIYFNKNDADMAFEEFVMGEWEREIHFLCSSTQEAINHIATLRNIIHKKLECGGDFGDWKCSQQAYIYNGSDGLPEELMFKLSSNWWWMNKFIVPIPENMTIK